ncbi:MAG TPA: alpha/beta family hydrolase [Actinomycetota bacterium]|jgi:predicted alpha/beta-hydrolase family hydrolase|nr:alpha/beta family hydrolase [Actinomycetota bacterium]
MSERTTTIETTRGPVSAAVDGAGGPVLVLAHGAGGDLAGPLLRGFAEGASAAGVRCLRFNFRYTEEGRRGPDREPALREVWTAAFEAGRELGSPVWVGGKSMGGRIASMMVADGELDAAGLVFVGYPLHPPGKPERIRDAHLPAIRVPMLFIQGTADAFARWDLLEGVLDRLGKRATLHPVEGGDHSFRVRGGPKDAAGTGSALGEVAARFILEERG